MEKYNLIIFEPFKKQCYLEDSYLTKKEAEAKGKQLCSGNLMSYLVLSETQYIKNKHLF